MDRPSLPLLRQWLTRVVERRTLGLLFSALLLCSPGAYANWQALLPGGRLIGSAEFRLYGFRVYNASLWGASAQVDYQQPFALELTYHRSITRAQLVDVSVDEIRRLRGGSVDEAQLKVWQAQMARAFVDVEPGQRIIGVFLPGAGARFYVDDRLHYEVADPAFSRAFFDIWFDPRTRNPELRQRLLGGQ